MNLFLKDHPGISTRLREQLEDIRKRVIDVQKRRGDAAKIRGMLEIIRDVAGKFDAQSDGQSTADTADWLRRADSVELAVRLAENQPRPEQKRTLARLRADTDVLLAELIEAARVRSLRATESPDDEAQVL